MWYNTALGEIPGGRREPSQARTWTGEAAAFCRVHAAGARRWGELPAYSQNASRTCWRRRRVAERKIPAKPTSLVRVETPCCNSEASSLSGCYADTHTKFAYPALSNQETLGTERAIWSMTDPVLACIKDGL